MTEAKSTLTPELSKLVMEALLSEHAGMVATSLARRIRLAHYTTAETAKNILTGKKFWMRKTTTMHDFGEVEHGRSGLIAALKDGADGRLMSAIDALFPGLYSKVIGRFDEDAQHLFADTYVACFSEHTEREDEFGKLSMWRAYGGACGVALVFKPAVFHSTSDALKIYAGPVYYGDWTGLNGLLRMAAFNIVDRAEIFRQLTPEQMEAAFNTMLRWLALSTKHVAFREENEWRAIYNPSFAKAAPGRVEIGIEAIRGVPQPIAKVALKDYPEDGFVGLALGDLVDRVIIGPTQYPLAVMESFVRLLEDVGVSQASQKVQLSNIPIRSIP